MNVVLCSISFRHELVSIQDLIRFAHANHFRGIELWGVHGRSLWRERPEEIPHMMELLSSYELHISMISDYIDLCADEDTMSIQWQRWMETVSIAKAFHTNRIRIFAGNRPSSAASEKEWALCVSRLQEIACMASEHGLYILVETHPNTYADTLEATLRLLLDVDHPRIRVNLDFLHLWESGTDPLESYRLLKDYAMNFHLKNVESMHQVNIFLPDNVFSPSGTRSGMTALKDGAVPYSAVMDQLSRESTSHPLAIEWFGPKPTRYLKAERQWLGSWEQHNDNCDNHLMVARGN